MAVTNNFSASTLDLNGEVSLSQPTALVWGPDGRLYITEVDGDVKVLTVAFGDSNLADDDDTAQFFVTESTTVELIKGAVQNHDDDGIENNSGNRQVTGIDVTQQYDDTGNLMTLPDGTPMVTMYVTSSDNRIGAGGDGDDANIDTNSGVITMMTQTGPDSWTAIDIVRGLPRSEENHATNGLEVIQEFAPDGVTLLSERMIVANGGNANTGAPSNNFAGQQEQPLSAAILEVDLTMLKGMPVLDDDGRAYVYDIPTLNDPARTDVGDDDVNDPFGGNDGRNSAKLLDDGPVSIYSPGYRNAYDVEVTDDGRVWTYDNGANNSWGGRPIGEAGDNGGATDNAQDPNYISTNLNNGEGNSNDDINLENWNPSNQDNFHEVTRSDDLNGGSLSVGGNGAVTTFVGPDGNTYVYGGHPNPTRAEGAKAGLLFSPDAGTDNAYLLVSAFDTYNEDGDNDPDTNSDYDQVVAWMAAVEANNADYPSSGIYGAADGDLTKKVLEVEPGVLYDIYSFADGSGAAVVAGGDAPDGGTLQGQAGLPADIAEIVAYRNEVEGDYLEGGKTDGALDSGGGSINGLAEYTSTILDEGDIKMSGAILATQLGGGNIIVMGRNADGTMSSTVSGGSAVAADRTVVAASGGPLGISTVGDDYLERGLSQPFQGSIWTAVYNGVGAPSIEIFQPDNGAVPLAGAEIVNPTDRDLDGVDYVTDPFEFSDDNGYAISPGESIVLDFNPQNTNFTISLNGTGLLGAALDGDTPNRDAQTAAENFPDDQQFDGLYNIGENVLPGGNAPILQIKNVVAGTVVGDANTARDVLHTGILPSADTDRIVATMNIKNWIPAEGGVAAGQLTGMIFGDGTQENFLRVVFGAVDVGGGLVPGIEVGFEINDTNYTVLEQIALPGLSSSDISVLDLRLTINKAEGFTVGVDYRLEGAADFTALDLGGFVLPEGVLRDVLTGDHTIGTGAAEATSGAAIGFLAETSTGNGLETIDFNELRIEAFGNEIEASTAAEVAQEGTSGLDTVIYDGTDTTLALDDSVENFDGSGSDADYVLTTNDSDNVIKVGSGANTITTGEGADSIQGSLDQLDGDTITDFSTDDEIIINGVSVDDLTVTYEAGSAVVKINDVVEFTLDGPEFTDFDPADGDSTFVFEDIEGGGVRLVAKAPLTPVIAINSGGPDALGLTVRDQVVDFVSDLPTAPKVGFNTGTTYNDYTNATAQSTDFPDTDLDPIHAYERSGNFATWSYNIDVPNGEYLVDLYFAEIFHGVQNTNDPNDKRTFNLEIEGDEVLSNYDIIDDAGAAATEVLKTFQVTVTDGQLNLDFIKIVDQAKLSGLVVWAIGGNFEPPADETAPEIISIVVENPPSVQDGARDVVVTLQDNAGFEEADFVGLTGADLTFSGIVPSVVSDPEVVLSQNGTIATLTYELQPPTGSNAWPTGEGQVSIAADAFGDAAGNSTDAASAAFILEPNLAALVPGTVVRAINVGTTDTSAATDLGTDLVEGGVDNNRYAGAIAADTLITDAAGNPIAFEADDAAYYTSPKTNAQLNANVDGESGPTGSNSGGVDLDGSALHTYRDSNTNVWTATYGGFANGTYVVELHFAELFQSAPGTRVGDFYINGELVEDNYDAFAEGGGADKPSSFSHNVAVTDGIIEITVDSTPANGGAGQAGYSAIVVYDAVPSDLPPTISVADVATAEGEDATITFTRIGDLTEAVTVEFSLTPDTAGAEDFGVAAPLTAVILAGDTTATVTVPIVDDEDEELAESFNVAITGVTNAATDAVISASSGSATVTIAANDQSVAIPAGGALFSLDFEGVTGEALAVGGFDDALGLGATIDEATSEVTGGKLVVQTAEGDINDGTDDGSINDFTKIVDVSDASLNELFLTTRFDNPFTQEMLTAQGVTGSAVPNYAQQGIVFGTGTQLTGQMVKLVWGGVAAGTTAPDATGIQMWSKGTGGVNQQATIAQMIEAGKDLFDVASVEMSLEINKSAGTVSQWVTLYDASGAIIGGTRPEATEGFFTTPPVGMPAAVLANLTSTTEATHFGVTSSDNTVSPGTITSFEASWDSLSLTSPQVEIVEGPDAAGGVVYGDFSDDGLAPTDIGAFENGSNLVTAQQVGDVGGRDRDYITFEVPEGQVLNAITLNSYDNEDPGDVQGFMALQEGPAVTVDPVTGAGVASLKGALVYGDGVLGNDLLALMAEGGVIQEGFSLPAFDLPLEAGTYTLWLNQGADLPTTVELDFVLADRPADVTLSIADAGDVVENGDFGVTVMAFDVTASDSFDGTLTVTYDTATDSGLTQDITFAAGVGALTVLVDNDNVDDGADPVSVTLTSAVDSVGTNTVAIASAAATGDGNVIEDDIGSGTGKGAAVFALNVNGPEVTTTDGVTYAADSDDTAWTNSNKYTDGPGANGGNTALAGGDYNRDGATNADDALYINERWGGGTNAMTYTTDGLAPGEYIMTLKLAELFDVNFTDNKRIFSVTINGNEVVTNLDLFDVPGLEVDQAYDVDVPVTIGADGILNMSFTATGDNAKINAFALYEAVTVVDPTDVTISVADLSADEDSGAALVTFTREGDTTSAMTITFAVADGTGVAGVDYEVPATNTVTILAGETTATVPVTLIDNAEDSADVKDFTVSITDVAPGGSESVSLGQGTATVTIDDDEDFDPADIDGDGILNPVDPFAYDGSNGLDNVLTVGGSFRQDFDVATTDVFSEEAGFTGIIVNTSGGADGGSTETDPYGDRTTEATSFVEDGVLKVESSETDVFGTGAAENNRVKDNYQRAADVSGVDFFSVEGLIKGGFLGSIPAQFASFGITLGAGGTNDYIKFVLGGQGTTPRIQLGQEDSLTGVKEQNITLDSQGIVEEDVASVLFRIDVDKSGETPTLVATAFLYNAASEEIGVVTTGPREITGSLAAALNNENPLTGGTGGIGYGVSITDWSSGDGNRFTGEWEYLELFAPDNAPEVDAGIAAQVATENTAIDFVLPLDVFKDDNGVANLTLSATLDDDSPLPAWLTFDPETGAFSGTPADGDGTITVKVSADDGTNPPVSTTFELTVTDIPGPFIWYADADGDGVGTSADQVTDYVAPGAPGDYVLSDLGDDLDDTDDTIYPDAPEINDGKDNDQDGDIDEDNQAPVAGNDDTASAPDQVVAFTRAGLLSNDTDADGDDLTFSLVADSGVNGVVSFDEESGIVSFTPSAGYEGPASFEYQIEDGFGGVTTQVVNITISNDGSLLFNELEVTNADTASYSQEDRTGTIVVDEETQEITLAGNAWKSVAIDSLIADGAPIEGPVVLDENALPEDFVVTEGMELWVTVNSSEIPELLGIGFDNDNNFKNEGTAIFQLGGTATTGFFNQDYNTYNPTSGVVPGEDVLFKIPLDGLVGMSFSKLVLVNDQDAEPQTATTTFSDIRIVTSTVANTPPLAAEDDLRMESDDALVITTAELLANDTDADGDELTVTAVSAARNGTVTLENGLITFEAIPDFAGTASFEYTIADPSGATSVAKVDIEVLSPGGGDVVTDIDFSANAIESYDDQDSKPGTGFEVSPDGKSLTLDGNVWKKTALTEGDYTVTEDTVLRFDMTILNGSGEIVAIALENNNAYRGNDDVTFQLFGSQNFSQHSIQDYKDQYDSVGETVSYEISLAEFAGRSFSTLALINDDDVNGTSIAQFANVKLVEELGTSGEETDAPQIFGDAIPDQVVVEDTPFEIDLPFFDTDTPFEDLVFTITNPPAFLQLEEGDTVPDGVLIGEPTNDDVGEYTVGVTATDPEGNSVTGTLKLTVENTNDAPEVTGVYDDVQVIVNNQILLALPDGLFTDIDAGTVLVYSAEGLPEGVTIDPGTGAISGVPLESGDFEITIIASDGPVDDPDTLSASTTFTMDIASGPPRETVLIEAEDFTAFTDPEVDVEGFFTSFVGTASGNQLIRLGVNGEGSISTKLDAAGVVPGFYDISVIHFDENDGISAFTLKLDLGDGSEPTVIGSYTMDRTDLPGQGGTTQAGNINAAVFNTVNIPAGAQLIIEGVAESQPGPDNPGREVLRIDAVLLEPIDNTPPTITTPAEATIDEGTLLAADVDATDLEGSEVNYTIAGGDDAGLFGIDPVTGEVSFLAAPDFETPLDANGDNVYDVIVEASDGDVAAQQSLVITVADTDEAPVTEAQVSATTGENIADAVATVVATDPENAAITYTLAGTGADEALFTVDPVTGVVSFIAAPNFETPGDADVDNIYELDVNVSDGTNTVSVAVDVTVTDENDAPVADPAPVAASAIIDAPLAVSVAGLFSDEDVADTLTYTLVSGAPAGVTGIDVDGNLEGTPTEIGSFDVVIEATDGTEVVQATLPLLVDVADNTFGPVAPSQDLDTDGTVNALDDDVDGDGLINSADSFAYDADNGTLIADGESIDLTFDVNGTPYQNGFTGLLQGGTAGSAALAAFDEDTGVTTVANGLLSTTASTGDTGTSNDPEDDFQLGVKNADFTVEARVINPFETTPAVSFDQIGVHVGVDSADFVKFVFGNTVEFSSRTDDVETKATGGNQPLPAGLTTTGFSAVDVSLIVNSTSATAATITATATFLDTNGDPIAGATGVSFGSLAITGAMAAALADEAVGVGTGFTHAHAPSSAPFTAQLDSFKVTATDGGSVDPSNALAVFEGETDIFTGNSYGTNEVGAAVLEVMTGNNNIQSSNFGSNSFELTNTGDKQIAAVFIDVSTALYPDSVFDPDGAGGDDSVKPWGINSGGAQTGASISGGDGGYFIAGVDPLANTTGTGQASNGGYKGAIIKFTDFQNGETVGFSGDMDPNSIAGLDKGSTNGVDTNATNGWDVGGISGHEIIGSTFTVLFDDGSTATGQLASDGSAAGSQGLATEAGFASDAPTLTVNGFGAGDLGTYGGTQPTILVTGDPGSTVRITMTKGFDPVGNSTAGIDTLVEDRLERYDFKSSNAFDAQSVDVVIGTDGTFDATGLFDYDDNLAYSGTFTGDDVAEIGFVASVVDPSQSNLAVSPVTKPIYLVNEGGPVEGDPIGNDGTNAAEVFAGESDLVTNADYADGVTGSAVLDIMVGASGIDASNFGANSFQVTNTGGKKISAVFIDVSDALYQDVVFDPDGAGGDNVAKAWAVNSAGGTGAYIGGGEGGYFLPGQDPLANTTGTGQASNGGFKGAIVKFTDFDNGETVGFSGDMDPNSIAGLTKTSVDTGAVDGWDVGGVSGHELIGSRFTVLFDDGTTASGQLGSDGSASGSQALADQGLTKATTPTLEINGVAAGGTGTYGVTQPTIIVTGDVGDTVRITMTKGFNPVENNASGVAQLVEDRLDRYDFQANNNFDSQSVDVVIGADGTFDATGLFDYDDPVANNQGDGTFAGDDVAQLGFVASVIDTSNSDLPISDVTAPIYLTNSGGPVTGDPVVPGDGFFEIIGSGTNNARFKIQVEDPNGTGGTNPGSFWTYATGPDGDGNQPNPQGTGYYIWKEGDVAGTNPAQGIIEYEIFIPEGDEGVYTFRARGSRDDDDAIASDQANDIWFRIDDDAEALQVNDTNSVSNAGFVKVFGVGTGGWGNAAVIDSVLEEEANFSAQFELTAGSHTLAIAGRSGGYAIDFFDFYKGSAPAVGASNSSFTTDNPGGGVDQISSSINSSSDDWEGIGGAGSGDLEFGVNGLTQQSVGMRFTNIDIPEDRVISEAYFQFQSNGSDGNDSIYGPAVFTIEIENTESAVTYSNGSKPDSRSYLTEDFDWVPTQDWVDDGIYRTGDISSLIEAVVGPDGVEDGALAFRVTGNGERAAHSFDSDGAAPELIIVFEDLLI